MYHRFLNTSICYTATARTLNKRLNHWWLHEVGRSKQWKKAHTLKDVSNKAPSLMRIVWILGIHSFINQKSINSRILTIQNGFWPLIHPTIHRFAKVHILLLTWCHLNRRTTHKLRRLNSSHCFSLERKHPNSTNTYKKHKFHKSSWADSWDIPWLWKHNGIPGNSGSTGAIKVRSG